MDIAGDFFEALGHQGEDAALQVLRGAAFDGQEPSPRARDFISNGEWDASKKLRLLPVLKDKVCWGILAPTAGPATKGDGTTYQRFCYQTDCRVSSHAYKVPEAQRRDGWYMEATGYAKGGACLDICFPYAKPPGPIDGMAAARLVGPNAIGMSFGQWRLVHREYIDQRVQSISSDSQEEELDPSPRAQPTASLKVDTTVADTGTSSPKLKVPSKADSSSPSGKPAAMDESSESVEDTPATESAAKGKPTQEDRLASFVTQLVTAQVTNGLNKAKSEMDEFLRALLREADDQNDILRDQLREYAKRNKNLSQQAAAVSNVQDATNALQIELRSLQSKIEFLESTQSIGLTSEQQDLLERLDFEVFNTHGGMSLLRALVQSLKNKLMGGGELSCHGISFGSMHEGVLWLNTNNLKLSLIADARALVQCIQPTVTTQDQATKTMEAQRKVDIDTNLEAAVKTSFKGVIPPALVSGKSDTEGGAYEVLSAYQKNFAIWDPPGAGKGLKSRLLKGVKAAIGRMETLQRSAGLSGEAYMLASGCIQDSNRFIMELANWKTNSYRELTEDTGIPKEEVWTMLVECEAKVWEDIDEARAPYADSARFDSAYYIWAMLKAREVQERYLMNNIQDDPALTGIFTRHILFHGEDMSLKTRLQGLVDQVTKADATAKTNSGEIKSNTKKIKDLEKELKKLQ